MIVGVNRFTGESEAPTVPVPDYAGMERGQVTRLAEARAARRWQLHSLVMLLHDEASAIPWLAAGPPLHIRAGKG